MAQAVLVRAREGLKSLIRDNVAAGAGLRSLTTPVEPPVRLKTVAPAPAQALRRFYEMAERRSGLHWSTLAALNFVESKFGRLNGPSSAGALGPMQFLPSTWDRWGNGIHRATLAALNCVESQFGLINGPSSAGALGPMQFLPSTWDRWGNGGDIMDPHDSILGAARYLEASGAPERIEDALYAYNHSEIYVDAILRYARQIRRDERNFYAYYLWQVFVRTTEGDVRLTGPER